MKRFGVILLWLVGCGPVDLEGQSPVLHDDVVIDGVQRAALNGTPGPELVFLNFDGVTITKDTYTSDAVNNVSVVGGGTVPAYQGTAQDKAQMAGYVRAIYAPYNVKFVAQRPASGDYNMVVIGGHPSHLGLGNSAAGGFGNLDCGNKGHRDVAFVFPQNFYPGPPDWELQRMAEAVAHELGHNLGLPHTSDVCDVMAYGACQTQILKAFLDKQMPAPPGDPAQWRCGMPSTNSHQLLLTALGPRPAADTMAPEVSILSPADGSEVATQTSVQVNASDNIGVVQVELRVDGTPRGSCSAPPFHFPLTLKEGPHTLVAAARDAAGNQATASITVSVVGPKPPPPEMPEPPDAPQQVFPKLDNIGEGDGDSLLAGPTLSGGCSLGGSSASSPFPLVALLLLVVMVFGRKRKRPYSSSDPNP